MGKNKLTAGRVDIRKFELVPKKSWAVGVFENYLLNKICRLFEAMLSIFPWGWVSLLDLAFSLSKRAILGPRRS